MPAPTEAVGGGEKPPGSMGFEAMEQAVPGSIANLAAGELRHSNSGLCVTIASLRPPRAPAAPPITSDDLALRAALRDGANI